MCEPRSVPSSLKNSQGKKHTSPVPKKLYFRIENNIFYDPVNEKQSRRQVQPAVKRNESSRDDQKRESKFRFQWGNRNANNLDTMVKKAASDPILTARHLSSDGTARLASWAASEQTSTLVKTTTGNHRSCDESTRKKPRSAISVKSDFQVKEQQKETQKHEPVGISKTSSKYFFDFNVDRSHLRNNSFNSRSTALASSNLTFPTAKIRSLKHNILSDNNRESSDELGSDYPSLDLPKNPFESVLINIPVLGFRSCGKTSLIKSLLQTGPTIAPTSSTSAPTYYYPMVIFNYQVFNFRLIDCPMMMQDFPLSTLDAWTDFRGWGLHVADFFILVFDITSEISFQYVKLLREQILAANMNVPMIIVANKIDLLKNTNMAYATHQSLAAAGLSIQRPGRSNGRIFSRNHVDGSFTMGDNLYTPYAQNFSFLSHGHTPMSHSNKMTYRRDLALLVKKHWKECVLVECSALYNFNTLAILKEVLRFVQCRQCGQKPSTAQTVQAVWRRNQCSLL